MVGMLNTKTGEMKSEPFAHAAIESLWDGGDLQSIPYFVEFGANKISRIDPDTMEIHETSCHMKRAGPGVWQSPPTMFSTTPTTHEGI